VRWLSLFLALAQAHAEAGLNVPEHAVVPNRFGYFNSIDQVSVDEFDDSFNAGPFRELAQKLNGRLVYPGIIFKLKKRFDLAFIQQQMQALFTNRENDEQSINRMYRSVLPLSARSFILATNVPRASALKIHQL
jgi:hypothetical protein